MSEFLKVLKKRPILADGATGSYLFQRTGRLSEQNHVYETISLENPDLIRETHLSYLRAGAQCLTTNTFGANGSILSRYSEVARLAEMNRVSVQLAREAISQLHLVSQTPLESFILGSVGPPEPGEHKERELHRFYSQQIEALVEEGVDALLLETFVSLEQVKVLLGFIRKKLLLKVPVIVEMALHKSEKRAVWNQEPTEFVEAAAGEGADVVGLNCCAPWAVTSFLEEVRDLKCVAEGDIQLSAMPNAGGFQRIGNRFMTHVNPEYMGRLARSLAESKVRLIGGCCEVHPEHIREMHNFLSGYSAGGMGVEVSSLTRRSSAGYEEKKQNGKFSRKLLDDEFVVSVEILPPRGTSPEVLEKKVEFVSQLVKAEVADALDITDGSRGIPLMPPADFATLVRERLGWTPEGGDQVEFIPHFTTRDLNIMGLQSRLIGFHAHRIHNVLFITGDPPKMSPTYPRSTAVFDADSVDMISFTRSALNSGVDFGGQSLGKHEDPRTHFTIGTGFEPEALDIQRELEKLRRKVDAGADYVMTQPAFRHEPLRVLEPFRKSIRILAGVMILTGLDHARRIAEIPGVVIPEGVFTRLEAYSRPGDQFKVAVEMAIEQVRWASAEGWSGLYLMSPASLEMVIPVLEGGLK